MGDYNSITQLIKNAAENISVKTGVRIETEISSEPITPIVNDPFMVKKACSVGKKVFGDRFFLTDKLYLAGDNACLYFNRVPGVFMVFRSELPDGPPLHNPKFILNEQHFYKALEMLHTYLTDIYR